MSRTLSALICGTAVGLILSAAPASAQATRTFVAGEGNDANPCSRTAPCRTFAGAFVKTFINGEINCLDPGGYGAVTITKSITIDCTGTIGSILASGVTGVTVSIPVSANDPHRSVRLRGLMINGPGASGTVGTRTGTDAIRVTQATSVFVEDTVIGEFTQQGIEVAASATTALTLDNVVIRNTNVSGVRLATSAGEVVASFNNVRIDGTPLALSAANNVRANIRDVNIAHNTTGIQTSGVNNIINAENLMISFAATGITGSAGSTVRVSNSVITQNSTGLNANGGSLVSMSGNSLTGNTVDGTFTSTVPKL
jgi:hypothetical protein